jgi:hypothetical protein
MVSEDLFISMKDIRVKYRFYNHSGHDVVTQVAFPVPDIEYGVGDFIFVIPTNDPENILNFKTTVNGRPVTASVERKAILDGVDQTKLIRSLGLPIAPWNQKPNFSPETWDRLVRLGLIRDTRNQTPTDLEPLWTLKTTYHWQQTFPAHQELVVEHRYLPSVGSSVPLSASNLKSNEGINRYCGDQDFWNSAADRRQWTPNYLEYILVTGANWAGPIKNFRLVIDKGSPNNLVSFCGSNVRKIGPTQFEVRMSNFTPKSNLNVLILAPATN